MNFQTPTSQGSSNRMLFNQSVIGQAQRKDAQEEFFKLLCVAFKINHVKSFPNIMKVSQANLLLLLIAQIRGSLSGGKENRQAIQRVAAVG